MTFGYTGGATNGANTGTSASVTHSQTINSGDLVVFYLNSDYVSSAPTIDSDSGGSWNTGVVEALSGGETGYHAFWWKIANGSEPSAYSATQGGSDQWRVVCHVFTSATDAEVDTAINTHLQTSSYNDLRCGAANSETINDNVLSVICGGKDNRVGSEDYTTGDNSYTGVIGNTGSQMTAVGYRIYTTGHTSPFSGDIALSTTDGIDGRTDKTYSMHITFAESAAGGANPKGPLGMPLYVPFRGPLG